MRLGWAIAGGLLVGGTIAWWSTQDSPAQREARQRRAESAAAANAEDARPVLYRWHDANGTVHVTDTPPKGQKYQRIDREPREGIEVRGDRE